MTGLGWASIAVAGFWMGLLGFLINDWLLVSIGGMLCAGGAYRAGGTER